MHRLRPWLCAASLLAALTTTQTVNAGAPAFGSAVQAAAQTGQVPDYPPAAWIPADLSNFSYANRSHDYPINLIVIHDIEGDPSTAIQLFQTPNYGGSAHYVTGYDGSITQMVREHDIAWHAGNWDYNTRAIGIEHAGFAYAYPTLYTTAEYNASAALAASICSRYGVPLDRNHVIGHYEVPDPNNPGQFGGIDHHTDPGPYWDWNYYMATAQAAAANLPSPPHMGPDPVATNGLTSVTVTWHPAQSCRKPITGYTVTTTPATTTQNLAASATSATINGLQPGTSYTVTVTATDPDGQDSLTSNAAVPGRCNQTRMTLAPASPQQSGVTVQLAATTASCANPLYQFWTMAPGASTWKLLQDYSATATYSWASAGQPSGSYIFLVRTRDANSPGNRTDAFGAYDDFFTETYTVTPAYCQSVTASTAPSSSALAGTAVTITGAASGCPSPRYRFWIQSPGSSTWQMVQDYTTNATFHWSTSGAALGTYRFSIWVQDTSSPGANGAVPNTYDAYAATTYTLTAPMCSAVSLSAAPASPQNAGASIKVTASATCPNANPQFQFVALWAGTGSWVVQQPYSITNTWTWNSTGAPAGVERFGVWAKDASSPNAYDQVASIPFTVTNAACTAINVTASPPTPSASGTSITVTATATCPNANPQFEFWALWAGTGTWILQKSYSTSNTWTWNSAGAPPGVERFGVWVKDASSSASVDAYNSLPYQVN